MNINANPLPDATSKEMKKYCSVLYVKISNDRWVQDSIRKACIDDGQVLSKDGNDLTRILILSWKAGYRV